jgi:hypothetical protein
MLVALALSLIATAGGAFITYTYDDDAPLASRLCSGTCIGIAALGLVGFVLALFLGLTFVTIALTALVVAAPLLLLLKNDYRVAFDADCARAARAISRASARPDRWALIYFFFYAGVAIIAWLVCSRAMIETPDGIATGLLNNFGDLPFHISVITRFAYGRNFPPEDPTFAGVRFTYPFITDFVSAMFVRAGASVRDSMFIENYFVGIGLVGVLHRFGHKLLRDRTAALLTPVVVVLNGGFGWKMLFDDAMKNDGGVLAALRHVTHSYTIIPETTWRWGTSITTLLLPQRGFLLGIPLAVIVFTLWWQSLQDDEEAKAKNQKNDKAKAQGQQAPNEIAEPAEKNFFTSFFLPLPKRMIAAGAIAGLLPLVHAHSFVVVMVVGACLVPWTFWRGWVAYGVAALVGLIMYSGTVYFGVLSASLAKVVLVILLLGLSGSLLFLLPIAHLRPWVCFFVLATVIAGPQILWSTHNSAVRTTNFFAWEFGWDSNHEVALGPNPVDSGPLDKAPQLASWLKRAPNVVWFWIRNTGVFIPVLIAALLWKREDYVVSRKLLLFYAPFTLCFIVPNFVKMAPWLWDNVKVLFYWWIASAPIVALLLARLWEGNVWNRVLAAVLLVMLTLAGSLDVFALVTQHDEYGEFDREGISFAEAIKQQTPPQAMILHAPLHNTPIFLTGRRSLMGYPGHIWTHGLIFADRESEIRRIFAGGPDAPDLLAKYGVDYVAVGPQERSSLHANETFFGRYQKVLDTGGYRLYKIKP